MSETKVKKKRYHPPSDRPVFVKMWNKLVDIITERENFLDPHLS